MKKFSSETPQGLSALDTYVNSIYSFAVILMSCAALCAAAVFTLGKIIGFCADINTAALVVFDICNFGYFVLAIIMVKFSRDEVGLLRKNHMALTNIFLAFITVFQWNYITYMFPFESFYGYAPFFLLVISSFFDYKLIAVVGIELGVSIGVSWVILGEKVLPAYDEWFYMNLCFRIALLLMSFITIFSISYFIKKQLISDLEMYTDCDALTGLLNRRMFASLSDEAVLHAATSDTPLSFCIFDIDNFKKVNDTFGHESGDIVLKFLADKIKNGVNKKSYVFRWGGEEFFVMLDCDGKTAVDTIEKIRLAVEESTITMLSGESIGITVTCGISFFSNA